MTFCFTIPQHSWAVRIQFARRIKQKVAKSQWKKQGQSQKHAKKLGKPQYRTPSLESGPFSYWFLLRQPYRMRDRFGVSRGTQLWTPDGGVLLSPQFVRRIKQKVTKSPQKKQGQSQKHAKKEFCELHSVLRYPSIVGQLGFSLFAGTNKIG